MAATLAPQNPAVSCYEWHQCGALREAPSLKKQEVEVLVSASDASGIRPVRTTGMGPLGAVLLSLFALGDASVSSEAAQPTHEQLMAACRAKYGKNVADAVLHKNGSVTCKVQVTRQMTRAEAFEACRKKYGATTILLHKTKSGWVCRYYGRY